jgi:hypothetical protein
MKKIKYRPFTTVKVTSKSVTYKILVTTSDLKKFRECNWGVYKRGNYSFTLGYKPLSGNVGSLANYLLNVKKGSGLVADHINGNTLDNRRENIRIATASENAMNRAKQANSKSKYKGVLILKPYFSCIKYRDDNGKVKKRIRRFDSEIQAAKDYDEQVELHFGKLAQNNFRKKKSVIEKRPSKTHKTKKGYKFKVSESDSKLVESHTWSKHSSGYLVTGIDGKLFYLHRLLMKTKQGQVVDHINGDKSDNRRCNLRNVSQRENCVNAKVGFRRCQTGAPKTSEYQGVVKVENRYIVYEFSTTDFYDSGKAKVVKTHFFKTEIRAARKYDEIAVKNYGKFARTNFPVK